jgi:hypothetical protein
MEQMHGDTARPRFADTGPWSLKGKISFMRLQFLDFARNQDIYAELNEED